MLSGINVLGPTQTHFTLRRAQNIIIHAQERKLYYYYNHKNYNFLACDWFKKVPFSSNPLARLLSDRLLLDSLLIGQFVIGLFKKPITFKDVVINHIQTCSYVCLRVRLLLCLCR